ncbi:hypothetical protein B0H34DRAFT_833812 [Crassisporium funariophilum]|nr:hypothetical protein B0H34DRAFT_833812 [Crassisporium funariophilum]
MTAGQSMIDFEERRAHYSKRVAMMGTEATLKTEGRNKGVEVGSAMDEFINVHACFQCRRKPPTLYFGIVQTSCSCCVPCSSPICCDLCHPQFFEKYNIIPPNLPAKGTVTKKSTIKTFETDALHLELKRALYMWRREKAVSKFSPSVVRTYGGKLVLGDDTVDWLIACAQAHKLNNILELAKETNLPSAWITELGESVLAMIHSHFPPVKKCAPVKGCRVQQASLEG